MQEEVNEEQLSQEELTVRKEEMKKFFEDSIPYLEAQCKHEEFLSKIAEARFKRMHYEVQLAMLMQGPQNENGSDNDIDDSSKPEKRKLKRE